MHRIRQRLHQHKILCSNDVKRFTRDSYRQAFIGFQNCRRNIVSYKHICVFNSYIEFVTPINNFVFSQIWGLLDYYKKKQEEFRHQSVELQVNLPSMGHLEPVNKRAKIESTFFSQVCEDDEIIKVMIPLRKPYQRHILPKSVLLEYTKKAKHCKIPLYRSEQVDKLFFSTVVVDGKQYANRYL